MHFSSARPHVIQCLIQTPSSNCFNSVVDNSVDSQTHSRYHPTLGMQHTVQCLLSTHGLLSVLKSLTQPMDKLSLQGQGNYQACWQAPTYDERGLINVLVS